MADYKTRRFPIYPLEDRVKILEHRVLSAGFKHCLREEYWYRFVYWYTWTEFERLKEIIFRNKLYGNLTLYCSTTAGNLSDSTCHSVFVHRSPVEAGSNHVGKVLCWEVGSIHGCCFVRFDTDIHVATEEEVVHKTRVEVLLHKEAHRFRLTLELCKHCRTRIVK